MKHVVAKEPERFLLVRFGAMGDIVHSLPAAAALRRYFPGARIDWVVEARLRPLLEKCKEPFLNEVISINTFDLRRNLTSPVSWGNAGALFRKLREKNYDVAVDLQGAVKSAFVCKASGASRIVGFDQPWLREEVAGVVYTTRVVSSAKHIVEANLELVSTLCLEKESFARYATAEFPLPEGSTDLPEDIPSGDFAVVNPGAGWRNKQWPAESFAALCDLLFARRKMTVVLNCGPQELSLGEQVQEVCRVATPVIFSGNIPALISLLRRSALMVGPDTGPLHLAAAIGVPTVGIYGPTDPARNGPYGPFVSYVRAPNARTSYRHGIPPDGSMNAISPELVWLEIEKLLCRKPSP